MVLINKRDRVRAYSAEVSLDGLSLQVDLLVLDSYVSSPKQELYDSLGNLAYTVLLPRQALKQDFASILTQVNLPIIQ